MQLPANEEFHIWKGITHPSFSLTLSNLSASQSRAVYRVSDVGYEIWISPSLQIGKTLI
jgi:hypothetical protein